MYFWKDERKFITYRYCVHVNPMLVQLTVGLLQGEGPILQVLQLHLANPSILTLGHKHLVGRDRAGRESQEEEGGQELGGERHL